MQREKKLIARAYSKSSLRKIDDLHKSKLVFEYVSQSKQKTSVFNLLKTTRNIINESLLFTSKSSQNLTKVAFILMKN